MAYKQKKSMISGTDPVKKAKLKKLPNPKTKAIHNFSGVDQNELTKQDMENKQDFNISNLHKDTKSNLKNKNYSKYSDLEKNDDDR